MKSIDDFLHRPLAVPVEGLRDLFPLSNITPPPSSEQGLDRWSMEENDALILSYLYQTRQPRRHLEFGTWQGGGVVLCLKSCNATVWTINLPDGETRPDGTWAYGERVRHSEKSVEHVVSQNFGEDEEGPIIFHRTDAAGYVGHLYREKRLGYRVCQIYCDSRDWDTSNYPSDFFDSVLVDGSHDPDIVISDSRKAMQVLGPDGIIMWHDFCPQPEIRSKHHSVSGVTSGIERILPELASELSAMYWIDPSWLLLGIKK